MKLPKTYKKLVVTQATADYDAATRLVEAPLPMPGPQQVLIRNLYAGVNASDCIAPLGGYGALPPFDAGIDSAGEVVAVGAEVSAVKAGDHAIAQAFGGGYAEYRVVDATAVIPVPRATPEVLAIYISGLTAGVALDAAGNMRSGETVLVTAAAGGAGNFAVQLAKLAGNHVIGTCGSDDKAAWLRELGCDRAINYRSEDLDAVLGAEYPDGIDLAFESVGRGTFDTVLQHMAVRGRLLCIGAVSEYERGLDWEQITDTRIYRHLLLRSVSVHGFFLPHYSGLIPAHFAKLLALLEQGKLRAEIDPQPFHGAESIQAASAYLRAGRNRGKVLVSF